jgi:uncharacterized protein YcfJ
MNNRKAKARTRPTTFATLMVVGLPGLALGGGHDGGDFTIEAPVTRVEPLVTMVDVKTPKEVCWTEPVYERTRGHRSNTPVIVGGAIGGLVGAALGDGRRSRRGLAAVGALIGAGAGYQHSRRHAQPARTYVTEQRICEIQHVTHQEERIDGYRVTYEYRGRTFVTHTATDPGVTIPVTVSVQPVTYNQAYSPGRPASRPHWRHRYET